MSPKSNQFRSVSPYSPQVDIKSTKKYNDMVVHNQTKMAER